MAVSSPLWGRARAAAGWITERLAANASKVSAAAICMLSIRSAASLRTSDPRPTVTLLALISPKASFGPSAIVSIRARARASSPGSVCPSYSAQPRPISTLPMSAISDRSPCPTDPTIRTTGCTRALSSDTSRSISSRLTPTPAFSIPLTRETIIARTTSTGSGRP